MTTYKVTVDNQKTVRWYNENQRLHREDGPAMEFANGDKYWYQDGQLHRKDGPAVEYVDGGRYWYQNGQLHRKDGPAIECASGDKEWYLYNQKLSESEFLSRTKKNPCDGKIVEIDGKKYRLVAE